MGRYLILHLNKIFIISVYSPFVYVTITDSMIKLQFQSPGRDPIKYHRQVVLDITPEKSRQPTCDKNSNTHTDM